MEWPKWASRLGQPECGALAAAFYFGTPRGRVVNGMDQKWASPMGQPECGAIAAAS